MLMHPSADMKTAAQYRCMLSACKLHIAALSGRCQGPALLAGMPCGRSSGGLCRAPCVTGSKFSRIADVQRILILSAHAAAERGGQQGVLASGEQRWRGAACCGGFTRVLDLPTVSCPECRL